MDSLINALNLLKNDWKKMSWDIGISIKTLNDFLSWNSSEKTKKLVISYLRQKQDALNAHMEDFDNGTIQTWKSDLLNKNQDTKIIDAYYKSNIVWTNAKVICYISKNWDDIDCNKCIIKKWSICHNKRIEDLDKSMDSVYKNLLTEDSPLKINNNWYYYFDRDYETSWVSKAMSILTWWRRDWWNDLLVEWTDNSLGEYVWYKPKKRNKKKSNDKTNERKKTKMHELDPDRHPSKELRNFAIKYLKHFDIEGNSALILAVEAIKLAGWTGNLSKDVYPYILKYYPEEAKEHLKHNNWFPWWIISNVHRYTRWYIHFCWIEAFISQWKDTWTFSLIPIN